MPSTSAVALARWPTQYARARYAEILCLPHHKRHTSTQTIPHPLLCHISLCHARAQVAQLNAAMSRSMDGCVYRIEGAGFMKNATAAPTASVDVFIQPGRGVPMLVLGLPDSLMIDGQTHRVARVEFSERVAMQAIGDQLSLLRQQRIAGARDVAVKIAALGR